MTNLWRNRLFFKKIPTKMFTAPQIYLARKYIITLVYDIQFALKLQRFLVTHFIVLKFFFWSALLEYNLIV